MRYYRFPFCTSFLARFKDCSLLRLHIFVLSYMSPCEFHACSYYRTISRLFPQSCTHFCLLILNYLKITLLNLHIIFHHKKVCTYYGWWGVHSTIRDFWSRPNHHHPGHLAISFLCWKTPIFRLKDILQQYNQHLYLRYLHQLPINHPHISVLIQSVLHQTRLTISLAVALWV